MTLKARPKISDTSCSRCKTLVESSVDDVIGSIIFKHLIFKVKFASLISEMLLASVCCVLMLLYVRGRPTCVLRSS